MIFFSKLAHNGEHSFSKLQLKKYLQFIMSPEKLLSLTYISIENTGVKQVSIDTIIKNSQPTKAYLLLFDGGDYYCT